MPEMTPEELALFEAHAVEEESTYALSILRPWVQSAHAIGHPPLTHLMEDTLQEAEEAARRAREEIERLQAAL